MKGGTTINSFIGVDSGTTNRIIPGLSIKVNGKCFTVLIIYLFQDNSIAINHDNNIVCCRK